MTTTDRQARMWAMLCHLSAFSGWFIPFGHILGPLIIWLIKRDDHPFINEQGKESLNFQISLSIYLIVSAILVLALIGFVLFFIVGIVGFIFVIVAAVKANEGVSYRYPLTIRFLR